MLIDWFTVVAQIVNFLLLVALLKHFLWTRLIKAIDDREKRIAGRLAEAEEKNHQAEQTIESARALAAEEERQRAALLAQAQRDAEEMRMRAIREARESVQQLERKWLDELDREKAAFAAEARRRTITRILAVIRRALADLACADLQSCTVRVFIDKLHSLDPAALHEISSGGQLKVLSAADLPEDQRGAIRQVLGNAPLEFVRDPDLSWGIELRAGGRKIGWNIDSYLDSLQNNLSEVLAHPPESALQTVT